jgi:hypothetical protein
VSMSRRNGLGAPSGTLRSRSPRRSLSPEAWRRMSTPSRRGTDARCVGACPRADSPPRAAAGERLCVESTQAVSPFAVERPVRRMGPRPAARGAPRGGARRAARGARRTAPRRAAPATDNACVDSTQAFLGVGREPLARSLARACCGSSAVPQPSPLLPVELRARPPELGGRAGARRRIDFAPRDDRWREIVGAGAQAGRSGARGPGASPMLMCRFGGRYAKRTAAGVPQRGLPRP